MKCITTDNFVKRQVSHSIFTVLVSNLCHLLMQLWHEGDTVCRYQIHLLLKTELGSVNDGIESES